MSEADELAARYFPREWSRVATAPGKSKARQQLRKRARIQVRLEELRAQGARCLTCRSYNTRPVTGLKIEAHCDRESDFHGYVEAKPDELCAEWSMDAQQEGAR